MVNKIFAHPVMVTWVIGASIVNAVALVAISEGNPLSDILSEPSAFWTIPLGLIGTTGLGYFIGMFFAWPFVRKFCSSYNSGSLAIGDRVQILAGPHKGEIAMVYEFTVGQGGWKLARLDLGEEPKISFTDVFETYSLLRHKKG